ncbi:MAG TPA: response regulator [Thermoanaerobaculia bacterium]|nr:response regulator [Thermoanaerobaculia bacterium]
MTAPARVLIVEDQVGDLYWLLDLIHSRGYEVVVVTNEAAAQERLRAVKDGTDSFRLAIMDIMVAVKDLKDLVNLDERFFEDSKRTGIRLCHLARDKDKLGLTADQLPIVCLTVRDDEEVREAMKALGIPFYNKAPNTPSESIREFIEDRLPTLAG